MEQYESSVIAIGAASANAILRSTCEDGSRLERRLITIGEPSILRVHEMGGTTAASRAYGLLLGARVDLTLRS